ncbi:MAG: FAD-dependent oxidoreductase [Bryobacterales bacterium]|nr:FAD-dependent oxidoreductase [Bryobacterales bacterium]
MRLTLAVALAATAWSTSQAAAPAADVIVYGGTAAGVAAAVQTARMGRSVILVAPEKHIGGITVEGLGSADINNHWFRNDLAVGGLAAEFYARLGRKYGKNGPVYRYESHVAESVFADMLREAKVTVVGESRLREPLASSVRWGEGRALRAIIVESGQEYAGRMFLDCTLEGDLLKAAGVDTTFGRESNHLYGETKNGIRAETTHAQFKVRVDPYRTPGDAKSGLIPTIQDEPLGTPGEGDHNIQAFCFRLCLTRNPANRIPFRKPANFDRSLYEIYFRYVRAGGKLWTPIATLPNGKTDLGSWHDLSANLYGMNREWPDGSYATRERIYDEHRTFTQGLLWLLANDPEMPEDLRAEWQKWGLCGDEFTDNEGWPRRLYVRDGRRMVSGYVITEHHTQRTNPLPVADPVAVAYWPTDTHSVRRIVRDGAAYNEGFVFDDGNWGPFGIAYRALLPKRSQAANLLTPTCPSSSHVAYGAIRLEQTFLSLGQAAATASVLALERNTALHDLEYNVLRKRLVDDGQIVSVALPQAKDGPTRDKEKH